MTDHEENANERENLLLKVQARSTIVPEIEEEKKEEHKDCNSTCVSKIIEEEFETEFGWNDHCAAELGEDICKIYIWTKIVSKMDKLNLPMCT